MSKHDRDFDRDERRSKRRGQFEQNRNVQKYMDRLGKGEKTLSHRRLKARALCTHCKEPMVPVLEPVQKNGEVTWRCKYCGEEISLKRLDPDKLNEYQKMTNQICDMIKLMSSGSDKDTELVEKVVADVQLKVNAYLIPAYNVALNTSTRKKDARNRRRRGGVQWGD